MEKLLDTEIIQRDAKTRVEQSGIVFIDEIDKVCTNSTSKSAEVSREGVQRDLLPLIEGTVVSTKYGPIKTDQILFFPELFIYRNRRIFSQNCRGDFP